MSACLSCPDPLPSDGEFAICAINNCKFHFDCAGVTKTTWNSMGQARRDSWKCKSCRSKSVTNDCMSKLHDDFLLKMEHLIKEQFSIYSKNVESQIAEFQKSVEYCCEQVDDFQKELAAEKNRVKCLETSNEFLKSENKVLRDRLTSLQLHVEDLDQYNRNRNVEIDGIPETQNENIETVVNQLSQLVGVNLNFANDVQAVHRVPTRRKSGIKPIILQFSNRQKRNTFLQRAKTVKIKSTSFMPSVPETFVYVNEHLTPYNRELLYKAKQLKEKGYKFVWPKEGKIFVKKSESHTDKAIHVTTLAEVEKLLK